MQNQSPVGSLEIIDLHKRFTRVDKELPVLAGLSFSAEPGQVLAILGKSGAGKTTLLNLISGLEQPDGGSVSGGGKVSYSPQRDLLLPWRTAESNAYLPFEIQHTLTDSKRSEISSLFAKMELSDFVASYPDELSGGMRQKVALVRSLAQDVPVYLFDESLSAIDFDSRLKLAAEIRSFLKEKKRVGIFVTHNIEEAISIADKVIVLSPRPAKIVHDAAIDIPESERTPVEIRRNPEFQQQFEKLWKVMATV